MARTGPGLTLAAWLLATAAGLTAVSSAAGAEPASFTIAEPLGRTWPDAWLTRDLTLDTSRPMPDLAALCLRAAPAEAGGGKAGGAKDAVPVLVPAQFSATRHPGGVRVLFKATLPKDGRVTFTVAADAPSPPPWPHVVVAERDGRTVVSNGVYEVEFDARAPLPLNALRLAGGQGTLGEFRWPDGVRPTGVRDEWRERGPARAVVVRTFTFADPALKYALTLDFRAGDPWIDCSDSYALGAGTAVTLDLAALDADVVYHPHTYNTRTYKPDGKAEDSTLQPPQHPIATLGPVWRDIWFGGGPWALIYRTGAAAGVGLAAVRGSEWRTPEGVTPESQNIAVSGDPEKPGRVRAALPTDGGERRWALVIGPADLYKSMNGRVSARADMPLEKVLAEWVLEWRSDAPASKSGLAGPYLGAPFNQHFLNPTTYPRRVRAGLPRQGPVTSRDLAAVAYVFSDPNYWPGPGRGWKIGNPNFHTDMYVIPLRIGLLMPDHPHAARWVERGVEETRGNLVRDSFPGGAWAESISYSAYFFHVVEAARLLRDAGAARPFRDWPRFKEVAHYLAAMHTPVDPRYGERQKAPIGDTHPGNYVNELRAMADVYRGVDDAFAEQLARFPQAWERAMDLSSAEFPGFGAMLRGSAYDDARESFVTIKAGPARNHYQGDELAFHFCSLATPLAVDHACHYSPRPWSAAIHNRPDMDGKRPVTQAARRAFATSAAADVFVADERTTVISAVPMEPHLATKPGWEYPTERLPEDAPWTMRRWTMLVKHDAARSRLADYLVLRDEIASPQTVGWNLHVLARDIRPDGPGVFRFTGQLGVDLAAHVLAPAGPRFEDRRWGWRGTDTPALRNTKGKEYEDKYFGAWIPETFERGSWGRTPETTGEMTVWLRLVAPAGRSDWLVVLVPHKRGEDAPRVERLSASSARITLGDETETVTLGPSDGPAAGAPLAAVTRGTETTVLLAPGAVE